MAATSQPDYNGRLTEIISQEIVDNVGIQTAPLKNIVKDYTPEAGSPNAPVITSVQLGNQPGRISHKLDQAQAIDPTSRTAVDSVYNDYVSPDSASVPRRPGSSDNIANYGKAFWRKFRIFPEFIAESAQMFSEPETENLNDPNFIRDKLAKPLKESVVRQVIGQYWDKLDPTFYVDYQKSSLSGNAGDANRTLSYSPLGIMTDYDEFGVLQVSYLHTLLRKQLLEPQYDALLTPDLYDGLAQTTQGQGSLNWVNYVGSTSSLQERMYLRLKGVNIHEVDPVDINGVPQHGGIPWNQSSGDTGSETTRAARAVLATNPVRGRPGEDDKLATGTGTRTFGSIYDASDGADKTVTTSMPVIGAVVHPRHMAFASWPQFSETQFAGGGLGFITRFFSDPLTGMNFRLRTYFIPEKLTYWFVLTVKFGFTQIDPQACALIFKD